MHHRGAIVPSKLGGVQLASAVEQFRGRVVLLVRRKDHPQPALFAGAHGCQRAEDLAPSICARTLADEPPGASGRPQPQSARSITGTHFLIWSG